MKIVDKMDFTPKTFMRDKEAHSTLIKGSIQRENTAIINIYTPTDRPQQYMKQKLTKFKGEIG